MSESQNSPPPQLGTNSSSVAIAILVPFFALIFTGFGFYLYKQRYVLKKVNLHVSLLKCHSAAFQQLKGIHSCHCIVVSFVFSINNVQKVKRHC